MSQNTAALSPERPERPSRLGPLLQLTLARLREFWREPEAVFWVYGFPILMTLALGIAFRERPVEQFRVDVIDVSADASQNSQASQISSNLAVDEVVEALQSAKRDETARFIVLTNEVPKARTRLRTGKIDLIVALDSKRPGYEYHFVPSRPESRLARDEADNVLQRSAGRNDTILVREQEVDEPGGRYIDFLVPGLLGMGLMGGGLWGVGFVTVGMRTHKLLKRLVATPMRKSDFLASLLLSRLVFGIPEVLTLLLFAWLAFGVGIAGSVLAVVLLILLGSFTFAGLGLLVASRAKTMEAVSGLMNLVMLPMWVLSGIFFSSERFPDVLQPFIRVLPLTALINALRAVMLEGASLWSQGLEVGLLVGWGVVTFLVALRIFRWS